MKERENIVNLILGRRGSRKSTTICEDFIPVDLKQGKIVYVISTMANSVFDKYKNHDKVKILVISSVDEITELMKKSFNCVFYFDDARGLFGLRMDEDVMRLIIHTRQMNCDLHFVYHSFALTCKDLFRVVDCFTIFKIKDDARARKEFFTESEVKEINLQIKKLKDYEHFCYQQ